MDKEKALVLIEKIQATQLMLKQVESELKALLDVEVTLESPLQIEEVWLGDDGKEYRKGNPYLKAKQWYCCGQPLQEKVENGKQVFHCEKCNSNYGA